MSRLNVIPFVILGLLVIAGCDTLDTGDERSREVVVESYLVAGELLPQIRLSSTTDIDATYNFTQLAESNARVEVRLLGDDGSIEEVHPYAETALFPGVYFPEQEGIRVRPLRTYALDIQAEDRHITSRTVIPDTFSLITTNLDTLIYQSDDQLELTVTRSFFPGRQNIFIFLTESLDPTFENLTPFAADVFDPDEEDLADLASGSSPLLNEGNYDVNPDDTITIKFPWLALAFYGPNRLTGQCRR